MITKKVEFLIDCEPKDGSGRVFEAGKSYDLPVPSALHWIRRKKAVEVIEDEGKPEKVKDTPKKRGRPPTKKDKEEKETVAATEDTEKKTETELLSVDQADETTDKDENEEKDQPTADEKQKGFFRRPPITA